jgi:GNAT superfamily N-acetyltransferase
MNLKELHSFKLSDAVTFHNELNPKLWNKNLLRPEVKKQLKIIADDFLQELGISGLDVKDITISGSNAAYSYTQHSDLDLHILVDMSDMPDNDVYRELFNAKKTIYNDMHDIKIHGIPVELYVQDSRQPVISLGEYSVMNDDWKRIPTKRRSDFDQTATKQKYNKILSLIEIALKSKKYSKVKHIIDTIKRYRQAGLDKGGEFGPENLAYKMLRSQGYITKLYDLRDKLHSEKLSFETMYQNIDEETNHWYDAGVKDAQRDAKLYPDRVVKKLNPRTRLKTMQDKRARHPDEVEQYSLGYRSLKQGVAEAFDTPLPITWEKGMHGDVDALAKLPDGSNLSIMFNKQDNIKPDDKTWMVEFYRNNSQEVTGEGDAQKVFSTVLVAIQQFITKYKPLKIYFSASKLLDPSINYGPDDVVPNPESRAKLYDRLLQRYAKAWGYRAFRGDTHASVMYELSRIPKQKAVDEDYTMQFASEKTPPVSPYAGVKDNQYRGGISEAADKKISFKVQKGKDKFSTTLTVNNSPAGIYQYDSNTGRSIAEVYPEFKGKGLGKLLVLHAIYTAAQLGLDFQEDESRTAAYDNVLDSLSSNGYIVDDDGYWYVTGEGEQYLKQSLNEASGYIPSEKQKNDPRYKTALTVDVHPDSIKKNAKAFYWNTSRAGIPPTAKTNGKIY